jgi:Flp pilus assembly protein TadD
VNKLSLDQARSMLAKGQPERAREMLTRLCDNKQSDAEVWLTLAAASAALRDFDEVIRCCRVAISLIPDAAHAHYNLGVALQMKGDPQSAILAYRDAVRLAPSHASSWANLGKACKDVGDMVCARESCEQALRLQPGHAVACNTLGLVLREQGMFAEALPWFEKARTLNTTYAEAHWNWALTSLNLGRYRDGWSSFEWRFVHEPRMRRQIPFPAWDGTHSASLKLLVCAEQGIGDQIMFASCIPDVMNVVGNVILEAEPRLQPLFVRSFTGCACLAGPYDRDTNGPKDIDAYLHGGSLPSLFRPTLESFPQHRGYLHADPSMTENWAGRYAVLSRRLKVGISWRGGNDVRTREARSIALAEWLPILRCPTVDFINLQYGNHAQEIDSIRDTAHIHDWPESDPLKDLDDFAAQIAALDLVISVDNTTVHMAGALGIPVWVLLPVVPDWRWVQGESGSPWYPTMRLFHQAKHGEWSSVIHDVAESLAAFPDRVIR